MPPRAGEYKNGQAQRIRVSCAAIALLASTVHAQQPPSAGDVLRDLGEKAQPAPPQRQKPSIDVAPEPPREVRPQPDFRIDLKGFRFTGLSVVRESDLQPLVAKYVGPDRTFQDLQAAASAVTQHLRARGYFVAQAYLPEQKLQDGIIEIAVLEGRLGEIRLDMDERAPVSRQAIARALATLEPGTVLHADTIERALFLASDLRGVTVRSVIEPGSAPGTSNLVVKVEPGRRVDGTIEFDNHGSRFTGENRASASLNVNSPLGLGDVLSLRGLVGVPGGGEDTDFWRVSYMAPVGRYGTRIGAAYLKLRYHLGTDAFRRLDQRGDSSVASIFALQPFVRARGLSLTGQANFDVREFHDDRRAVGLVSDRRIKAGALALLGDWRDSLLGGAINNFSLTATRGDLEIETPADFAADQGPGGRRTHGSYSKLNASIARINALTESASLYVTYSFQLATKNLDGSEKVSLGGPSAVRAYAQGESTADEAQLLSVEARYALPRFEIVPGNLVASVFYDVARGKFFEDPLPTDTLRHRTLQGAGFGLSWSRAEDFFLRGTVAWRTSGAPTSDPVERKPRLYFQAVKYL